MNATVSDGRITIIFSHKLSAANYDRYLRHLEDAFYAKQNCELAQSGDAISMDLPAGITTEPDERLKDVNLVFSDEEEAMEWEAKMMLWRQKLPEPNKRRLSRALTIEQLNEELDEAGKGVVVGFLVRTRETQTNIYRARANIHGTYFF